VDEVVTDDPEGRTPLLLDVRRRDGPVGLVAAGHREEVRRRRDQVVGERGDVPPLARRRAVQQVAVDLVEDVPGLVHRPHQHPDVVSPIGLRVVARHAPTLLARVR